MQKCFIFEGSADPWKNNKTAELLQIWPHNAPSIWVPWKFFESPWVHTRLLLWAFVAINPVNVHTKFEVHSFTRSW